jgi:Flp pilus assembly protein TadG
MHRLRQLLRHEAGAVMTVFAFATPAMIGGALFAVDMTSLARHQAQLQNVADTAALSGAKELHLYRDDEAPLESGVRERALAMLAERRGGGDDPSVEVTVDGEQATVTVTVEATPSTIVLDEFGYGTRMDATAVAHAFGSARLCVLALDTAGTAIAVSRIASIDAAECAVQSNSGEPNSISLDLLSRIEALGICSSGGVSGPSSGFSPEAETDCPPIEDPLVEHTLPAVGACDHTNLTILLPRTISPGHYCGGLTLGPLALVTARPGEYVISGGPLLLGPASSLTGEGVSFRFVDADSTFTFGLGSIVSLSAPTTGPMAGYLFFQDPGIEEGHRFRILTDLATKLLGTIYLPSGTLDVDVVGLVAAQSAYTVIVANDLDIKGADLVINSDYGATDVPVPSGVGPLAGEVALSR